MLPALKELFSAVALPNKVRKVSSLHTSCQGNTYPFNGFSNESYGYIIDISWRWMCHFALKLTVQRLASGAPGYAQTHRKSSARCPSTFMDSGYATGFHFPAFFIPPLS